MGSDHHLSPLPRRRQRWTKIGNPLENEALLGTLTTRDVQTVEAFVAKARTPWLSSVRDGARLVAGGQARGRCYEPTLIQNLHTAADIENVAGPVCALDTFVDATAATREIRRHRRSPALPIRIAVFCAVPPPLPTPTSIAAAGAAGGGDAAARAAAGAGDVQGIVSVPSESDVAASASGEMLQEEPEVVVAIKRDLEEVKAEVVVNTLPAVSFYPGPLRRGESRDHRVAVRSVLEELTSFEAIPLPPVQHAEGIMTAEESAHALHSILRRPQSASKPKRSLRFNPNVEIRELPGQAA